MTRERIRQIEAKALARLREPRARTALEIIHRRLIPARKVHLKFPTTPAKRKKEKDRQDRRQEKEKRREQRKHERAAQPLPAGGEDPDIAGIVPGPQPPQEE